MFSSLGSLFGRGTSSPTSVKSGHTANSRSAGIDVEAGPSSYPPRLNGSDGSVADRSQRGSSNVFANVSAPRVKHTLARIRTLTRKLKPELIDTLSYAAPRQTIAELQQALRDYVLLRDVVESYQVHDGQDSFSVPRSGQNDETEGGQGYIYGLWWMSIEEVLEEYQFWRRLDISSPPSPVAQKRSTSLSFDNGARDAKGKGREQAHNTRIPSSDAVLFGSEMDPRTVRGRMRSCPPGFIREEYSHPAWLPLLKDGYGNYIGVDLDPPDATDEPSGMLNGSVASMMPSRGQVIAFGREIDTKTVLWNGWCDSSAHDANIGGGWARFLSSYADDLAACTSLSHSRSSQDYSSGEDDEYAYRVASGGRQEASTRTRRLHGLEWMDASPAYADMSTIEALVERSKRHWASIGLYAPDDGGDAAGEVIDMSTTRNNPHATPEKATAPRDRTQSLAARGPKPAPLVLLTDTVLTSDERLAGDDHDVQPHSDLLTSEPAEEQEAADLRPTDNTAAYERTPNSGSSRTGLISGADTHEDIMQMPNASSVALIDPLSSRSLSSPEPALVLSPPSPSDASTTFQNFPGSADAPAGPASPSRVSSPKSAGGLQSPARFSPAQAQRYASRQEHRAQQQLSPASSTFASPTRRSRQAPPPIAPLGLPTLEWGNGTWQTQDTNYHYDRKDSFNVVVDRRF